MSLDWYVNRGGQQAGPFPQARVLEMLRGGQLGPEDYCWSLGMSEWQPIGAVPALVAPAADPLQQHWQSMSAAANSLFAPFAANPTASPAAASPQPAASPFPAATDDYVANLHFFMSPTSGIEWLFESIDSDLLKVHLDGRMIGEATYRDGFQYYWQLAPGNHLAEIILWDRKERDRKKLVLRVPEQGNYQVRFNLVKGKGSKIQESTIDYLSQPQ